MADASFPNFKNYAEGEPIPPVDPEDVKRFWKLKPPWGPGNDVQSACSRGANTTAVFQRWAMIDTLTTYNLRPVEGDLAGRERTARVFLIGLAAQYLHFMEEFVTRFEDRFPAILGLPAWPENFFVVFNLIWLSIWILSAIGLQRGYWFALFPIWFFAIAAIANGIAHPMLAVVARGYFPGLITSPLVGVLGVLLWLKLQELTRSST